MRFYSAHRKTKPTPGRKSRASVGVGGEDTPNADLSHAGPGDPLCANMESVSSASAMSSDPNAWDHALDSRSRWKQVGNQGCAGLSQADDIQLHTHDRTTVS